MNYNLIFFYKYQEYDEGVVGLEISTYHQVWYDLMIYTNCEKYILQNLN